ncbi:uncharacterized protein HKW66_Vig0170860 [Vigna angularis]|uniref:Uncharacterized protein n=1 Tax=Phaseolus angularis TaxID=3914 RepID=A0A8T0JSX7_PHAAN|nr:uncharacterized protein HKW66_Vig0170860 [Vigna angularis]
MSGREGEVGRLQVKDLVVRVPRGGDDSRGHSEFKGKLFGKNNGVAAAGRDSLSSKSGSVVLKDVPPSHDDIDDTLHDAAAKFDHSQLGDSSLVNQLQSNLTDNLVNSKLSHINPESELSSAKAAMEVSQHSSIETHEDISQNSDCSVAV